MNTFKRIQRASALAMSAILLFFSTPALAATLPVQVIATDAVAGYPAALRTSLIDPGQNVRFVVEKPDNSVVQISAQADLEGVAKADLYGHQTKQAGTYRVAVTYPGSNNASPQTPFTVYPDRVSASQSTLRSTLQLVEVNSDATFLVVTLFDAYRNPIKGHRVSVISSRSDDQIQPLQEGITNDKGVANFKIKSRYAGVSVFTAIDTTVNETLLDREEVVFFAPEKDTTSTKRSFTDFLKADIGQGTTDVPSGPVDHFEISGVPNTAKVGELLSITITAQDADDNTVKDYTGTILFSVPDDENAVLPNNGTYTFKDSDLGTFTFDLSLQFSKLGFQAVQVFDQDNFRISGEFPIEIVSNSSVIPAATSDRLTIKSPADGSQYGNNLLIITGSGPENINLKVFDNDARIGNTETDSDGFFSFEAKNLSSGSHSFYVMSDSAEVSNAVTVFIDTVPPALNDFEVSPQGSVEPGTLMTLTAQSEPNLDSVSVRLQGIDVQLRPSAIAGNYTATLAAPAQDGVFPLDVTLVDSFGNKADLMNRFTLTVSTPEPVTPPQVSGVSATPIEEGIELSWSGVINHERPIQSYRVYYGTSFSNLDSVANTLDARTQFVLTGLAADAQYFVALKAVDTQGLESDVYSDILAVTPLSSGPAEPTSVGNATLQATPYDSAVQLEWQPFDSIRAFYYQIHIGVTPGVYDDSVITQDNRTSVTIGDLINGLPYYFAVSALDVNGNQITQPSEPIQVVPSGTGFRPAAGTSASTTVVVTPNNTQVGQNIYRDQLSNVSQTSETGPASTAILLLLSLTVAHFMFLFKRTLCRRDVPVSATARRIPIRSIH